MSSLRLFAIIAGIVYALVGLLGFIPGLVKEDISLPAEDRRKAPDPSEIEDEEEEAAEAEAEAKKAKKEAAKSGDEDDAEEAADEEEEAKEERAEAEEEKKGDKKPVTSTPSDDGDKKPPVSTALRDGFPRYFAGRLLGLFPVNILHSLVHVAIGAWGLLSMHSNTAARGYARGLAIVYILLAVIGMIPFSNPTTSSLSTVFGLIPVYGHDVWLHALTALVAGYFGWATPAGPDRVTPTTTTTTNRM